MHPLTLAGPSFGAFGLMLLRLTLSLALLSAISGSANVLELFRKRGDCRDCVCAINWIVPVPRGVAKNSGVSVRLTGAPTFARKFQFKQQKPIGLMRQGAGQREAGNISACESRSNIGTANAATPEASDRSLRRGKKKTAITHAPAIKASATMPNLCLLGFSLYAPYGDLFP